jgi:hypothetical protein
MARSSNDTLLKKNEKDGAMVNIASLTIKPINNAKPKLNKISRN